MKNALSMPRRHMLAGSAAALGALGMASWSGLARAQVAAKPLPAYAGWKDPKALIVHSSSTLETRRSAFGTSVITPTSQLYVRNNLPAPDAAILDNRDAWTVAIEGVKNPRVLTLAELKTLGVETVATVLQCSGNGRGFFPSKPSGTPWSVGAAGCALWSGVPVRQVVAALGGAAEGMAYLTGTGGEKLPEGVDPLSVLVERSVPIKALEDAVLAWELNGEPIPLAHGGPVRLIVPGYQGVNNIKYVKRLALTREQSAARIMSHGYRMSPPGTKASPEQPSVWEMTVKSWINGPLSEQGPVKAGLVQVHGVAFGGTRAVQGVEVSADGGKTWQKAQLVGPDLGRFAWRQFVLPVQLAAGTHVLASRATDAAGNVQPAEREENLGGYNNTSWRDHAVTVTVA
ncbi:SorT family sulfite dehydrogenase catalytic subunit [Simplicispira lacusdiani]|uniref:SorT family sulfite dehydrogenase catalytic subunit n=1 Tax=Simplicispira lacusdiani TaxID=2213010 RepID=UPI000E732D50|nr:sulfite oxidase [Simplicispira lacusdiani]